MEKTSLIAKILSGSATEGEKQAFAEWMNLHEENREEFKLIKLLYHQRKMENDEDSFYEGLNIIKDRFYLRQRKARLRKNAFVFTFSSVLYSIILVLSYFYSSNNSKSSYITFDHALLGHVIPIMEDAYGIKIEVESKAVLACTIKGTFYQDRNPHKVLQLLTQAANLSTEKFEGKYLIKGNGCMKY
jgi:hypothetical protein